MQLGFLRQVSGLALVTLVAAAFVSALAQGTKDKSRNMPLGAPVPGAAQAPPQASFTPMRFEELPGWAEDDHLAAFKTFVKSCGRVAALAKSAAAGTVKRKPAPPELLAACDKATALATKPVTRAAAKAFFETTFTPHRVVHTASPGLLTGYYEPVLEGSRTPDAKYSVPVYRRPPDLVNLVDETERAKGSALTHARKTEKGVAPYPTRAEIDKGALTGQGLELLYLADPVDLFFMQVQGSGRVKLSDGSLVRISYDGKNGHPYTSIGRYLIDKQLLPADKVSLDALSNWLRANKERGREVMWQNASYVFFRELTGEKAEGPLGALEVGLTPFRSLAVDTAYHALGTPIYVTSPALKHAVKGAGFHRLMIAQDVGSAIKGPERGDIYFGSGAKAGKLAGITKHAGNFIVLLPTPPAPQKPADPGLRAQQ